MDLNKGGQYDRPAERVRESESLALEFCCLIVPLNLNTKRGPGLGSSSSNLGGPNLESRCATMLRVILTYARFI